MQFFSVLDSNFLQAVISHGFHIQIFHEKSYQTYQAGLLLKFDFFSITNTNISACCGLLVSTVVWKQC